MIDRGVAMKVLEGQSTFSPRTPAKSSAARAAPLQPPVATEPSPCRSDQAASKRAVISPSDQRSDEHDLVPELVEPGEVAAVEADRKLAVVSGGQGIAGVGSQGQRRTARRGHG